MKYLLFFTLVTSSALYPMNNDKTPLLSNKQNQPFLNLINSNYDDEYRFEKTLAIKGANAEKVAFDPNDCNIVYSGSSDNTVKVWDINNNKFTTLPKLDSQRTNIIAINSDGTRLAACGWNRSIALFDLTSKILKKTLQVSKNEKARDRYASDISRLAFSQKNRSILAVGLAGDYSIYGQEINTVNIFNTENGNEDILTGNMKALCNVLMNPHDEKDLIITSYKKVDFWDIEQKKCIQEVNNHYDDETCIHDIVFHPQKNTFITTKNIHPYKFCSHYIDIWNVNEKKRVQQILTKGFGNYGVAHLAIHPDCNKVIATGYRLTKIFDLRNGNVIQTLPNKSSSYGGCFCSSSTNSPKHNSEIKQVALSNDGKNLATVAGTIKIWNQN